MMITSAKVDVAVAPYIEGDELIIDIQIDNTDIQPVRMPLAQLFEEYLEYNSEIFSNSIAAPNRDDAKELIGILRLAAHTLEQALS
jgi:hypothetical protein